MANATYLRAGSTPGTYQEVTASSTSAGSADAGKVVALGIDGFLDPTVLPTGIGASTISAKATEALVAGNFVHVVNSGGELSVNKALAAGSDKPANGFVLASVDSGAAVSVYVDGLNTLVPKGTLVVGDIGKEVCLSATVSGECSLTVPVASPAIIQPLGSLVSVGATYAVVNFVPKTIVLRA